MYDQDIRKFLKDKFTESIFVDEVVLGKARIDLLDISTELHGYEIKSDFDSFERLKNQRKNYNKYLSKITVVVGLAKKEEILLHVPEFWGILLIYKSNNNILIEEIRKPKSNPYFDKSSACSLLWRSELLDILCLRHKVSKSGRYSKLRRWKLTYILQKEITKPEVIEIIRSLFIKRLKEGWRLDSSKEED